jgi:predicted RNA binding protein YcfA (HicA-like mRNA interferase family)
VLSGRQAARILDDNGFVLVRQRGSHLILQLRLADSTITVPVPGTLLSVIRQSRLPRVLFEEEA